MTRYTLYAWQPKHFDPRTSNTAVNKVELVQTLNNLPLQPPHKNQPLINLVLEIQAWAKQQQQNTAYDRVTVRYYEQLANSFAQQNASHLALNNLPSINFDSFYYMFITKATSLGLMVHSDIDNGTYYPDMTSEPAFLMRRLDMLKLKQPVEQVLAQIIKQDTNPPLASNDVDALAQLKVAIVSSLTTKPINYELKKHTGALAWDAVFEWHDSTIALTFLLQKSLRINQKTSHQKTLHQNTSPNANIKADKTKDSDLKNASSKMPAEPTHLYKLDVIFKISPPEHYTNAAFKQLFTGVNALNILYKNKMFIEGSLSDVEKYQQSLSILAKQIQNTNHAQMPMVTPARNQLARLDQLTNQVATDTDFIFNFLNAAQSFYHLFDTIYQDKSHPLHDFYWGKAETRPLAWSRFSRRHNLMLTQARLLQHPDLANMIAEQRPLLLAYYDKHLDTMPVMSELKVKFLQLCDKLMEGYAPHS